MGKSAILLFSLVSFLVLVSAVSAYDIYNFFSDIQKMISGGGTAQTGDVFSNFLNTILPAASCPCGYTAGWGCLPCAPTSQGAPTITTYSATTTRPTTSTPRPTTTATHTCQQFGECGTYPNCYTCGSPSTTTPRPTTATTPTTTATRTCQQFGECGTYPNCYTCGSSSSTTSSTCGNGKCDGYPEDCGTCLRDCPCPSGTTCQNRQCVSSSSTSTATTKTACPYDCCVGDSRYNDRYCQTGTCGSDHKCPSTSNQDCPSYCDSPASSKGCSGLNGVTCSAGSYYCSKTNQCYSSQTTCSNSCGGTTNCKTENQDCIKATDCCTGLTCTSNKCVKQLPSCGTAGGRCFASATTCQTNCGSLSTYEFSSNYDCSPSVGWGCCICRAQTGCTISTEKSACASFNSGDGCAVGKCNAASSSVTGSCYAANIADGTQCTSNGVSGKCQSGKCTTSTSTSCPSGYYDTSWCLNQCSSSQTCTKSVIYTNCYKCYDQVTSVTSTTSATSTANTCAAAGGTCISISSCVSPSRDVGQKDCIQTSQGAGRTCCVPSSSTTSTTSTCQGPDYGYKYGKCVASCGKAGGSSAQCSNVLPCNLVGSGYTNVDSWDCTYCCVPSTGCKTVGVSCSSNADCCSNVCTSLHLCGSATTPTSTTTSTCQQVGGYCSSSNDCCSNVCTSLHICGGSGTTATTPTTTTCQQVGGYCSSSNDCCSNVCTSLHICGGSGTTQTSTPTTSGCKQSGAMCASNTECCSGSCYSGKCTTTAQKCSDGTEVWQCSASKPARCIPSLSGSPSFQDVCSTCGCTDDTYCVSWTGHCSPRLSDHDNCLTWTGFSYKCSAIGELETYGYGCSDWTHNDDNCPKGKCVLGQRYIKSEFCYYGCDASAGKCKAQTQLPSCTNDKKGTCKSICLTSQGETDVGTADCKQTPQGAGQTCCVSGGATTCGAQNQPCCSLNSCNNGLACSYSKCIVPLPSCTSLKNGVCRTVCLAGEGTLQGSCTQSGQTGGQTCCEAKELKCKDLGVEVGLNQCHPTLKPKVCRIITAEGAPGWTDDAKQCGCPTGWHSCQDISNQCCPDIQQQQISPSIYQYSVPSTDSLTLLIPSSPNVLTEPIVVSDSAYTDYTVKSPGDIRAITFIFYPEFKVVTNTFEVVPS